MTPSEEIRGALADFLEREMVGPHDAEEILKESPCYLYSAGILFPQRSEAALEADDEELDDANDVAERLTSHDQPEPVAEVNRVDEVDPVLLANTFYPSALALSFACARGSNRLQLDVKFGRYERRTVESIETNDKRRWCRVPVSLEGLELDFAAGQREIRRQLADGLMLVAVRRTARDKQDLVTIAIYNTRSNSARGRRSVPVPDCFFQVEMAVRAATNLGFLPLHHVSAGQSNEDEETLALLYADRPAYARGHGCAADWSLGDDTRCVEVRTCHMPRVPVTQMTPRSGKQDLFRMDVLGSMDEPMAPDELAELLGKLVTEYGKWIDEQRKRIAEVPGDLASTAERHMKLCSQARDRMAKGINFLRTHEEAHEAFVLANRAMLMQQYHFSRKRRHPKSDWEELPGPGDYRAEEAKGRWRAFQLAFILMNVEAFHPAGEDKYAGTVDLIWFPTGGGKTEAYLGLSAYVIFLRRLLDPKDHGCAVLMRYTLRLLTAQQFQRASALICACEVLRSGDPERLGSSRISIGLWVGQSLSPNSRDDALKALRKLRESHENPFQILSCPWCGTAMDETPLGYKKHRRGSVNLVCPERNRCPFSRPANPLPIHPIDEDIYEDAPTFIVGTVDKFAMLAWRPQAGAIFGLHKGERIARPPSLVIQDELHLISGPLGSMVGLYEGVIELLCTDESGNPPKIVASTATIRNATDQCLKLYGRDVFQFPPPGLTLRDSFFSKEDTRAPARMYAGVLPSAVPSATNALVRVIAALMQGISGVDLPDEAAESARDPYWTLVSYFGSLRELGWAATLASAGIPEQLISTSYRLGIKPGKRRYVNRVEELTGRRKAHEIPRLLGALSTTYPPKEKRYPIDLLLATNMLSVGVDIPRLGLMVVFGQPKSYSEYIQATSRVGRSHDAPGLIVTLQMPARSRDRSCFEQFRGVHESLYRYVEPISATPYAPPVLERALHSVLIIAARHWMGVEEVQDFKSDAPRVAALTEFLLERCDNADANHTAFLKHRLEAIIGRWKDWPGEEWGSFFNQEEMPLMYPAGSDPNRDWHPEPWATPMSMRNVDVECGVRVVALDESSE